MCRRARVCAILVLLLAACRPGAPTTRRTTPPTTASTPTASPTVPASPTVTPAPTGSPSAQATAAPAWLGTRVLEPGPTGFPPPQPTPDALVPRSIVTEDVLPPPPDDDFHATVARVDDAVAARSTWHEGCPVAVADLRYVTVSFVGFDGAAHTGELLIHADAADAVVAMFRAMHDARFPLEQVAITTPADLDAPPTGDGNVTSAFVCRDARGSGTWSEHAYGRAVDINPFQNPYVKEVDEGRIVLPELATAYTDRSLDLPGMLHPDGPVVAAIEAAGWTWGGTYTSLQDLMHASATGR